MTGFIYSLFLMLLGLNIGLVIASNGITKISIYFFIFLVLALTAIKQYDKIKSPINSIKQKLRPMDATENLMSTRLFWLSIIVPLASSATLILLSSHDRGLSPELSPHAFNTFIDLFKLPIAIAGLSIPLAALVASQHRSIQASRQIKLSTSQNNFSNYIDHRQLFDDFFRRSKKANANIDNDSKWMVYQFLFPESANGDLSIGEYYYTFLKKSQRATQIALNTAKDRLNEQTLIFDTTEIKSNFEDIYTYLKYEADISTYSLSEPDDDPIQFAIEHLNRIGSLVRSLTELAFFCSKIQQHERYDEIIENIAEFKSHCKTFHEIYKQKKQLKFCLNQIEEQISQGKSGQESVSTLLEHSVIKKIRSAPKKSDIERVELLVSHHLSEGNKETMRKYLPKNLKDQLKNVL